jgi:hypothetical protein
MADEPHAQGDEGQGAPPPAGPTFEERLAQLDVEIQQAMSGGQTPPPASGGSESGEGEDPEVALAKLRQSITTMQDEVGKTTASVQAERMERALEREREEWLVTATESQKLLAPKLLDTKHGVEGYKVAMGSLIELAAKLDDDRVAREKLVRTKVEQEISAELGRPITDRDIIKRHELGQQDEEDLGKGHGLSYLSRTLDGFAGHRDTDDYRGR